MITLRDFLSSIELIFLAYFLLINLFYTVFLILGSFGVFSRKKETRVEKASLVLSSNSLPEILFIMPIHNESEGGLASIHTILKLSYRLKKVVAINDGSTDNSLEIMIKGLDLQPIPKFYDEALPTKKVKTVYRSRIYPNVIVIDKEHGGKSDTVNAGINSADTPFFIVHDADTFIDNTSFETFIRPFLTFPSASAVGANVRIRNGCVMEYNRVVTATFPQAFLPAFQALEYLRSFLLRQGLDLFNGHTVIAGAFSILSTDLVKKLGGFGPTLGEDMEIILRIHVTMRRLKWPYLIKYFPDPVAWTIAPGNLKSLRKQRVRWHVGVLESIWFHKKALFNPCYGTFGLVSLPILLLGEALEPLFEGIAFIYIIVNYLLGTLNIPFFLLFLIVTSGYTFLYSIYSLVLEEWSFRKYPSIRSLLFLLATNFFENFGYRQLNVFWRIWGFFKFVKNRKNNKTNTKYVAELVKNAEKKFKEELP